MRARRRDDPQAALDVLNEAEDNPTLARMIYAHHKLEERAMPPGAGALNAAQRRARDLIRSGLVMLAVSVLFAVGIVLIDGFVFLHLGDDASDIPYQDIFRVGRAVILLLLTGIAGLALIVGEVSGLRPSYRFARAEAEAFGGVLPWARFVLSLTSCLLSPVLAVAALAFVYHLLLR